MFALWSTLAWVVSESGALYVIATPLVHVTLAAGTVIPVTGVRVIGIDEEMRCLISRTMHLMYPFLL